MASLGNLAESGVIALAVSEAAGAVVEPALEPARQEAEKATKARIHDLEQLAQSVAQALLTVEDVTDHAERNGYDSDELALSVQLALRAPGVGEALSLYRRRKLDGIDDGTAQARLYHAFAKAQVEYQYWPQLLASADLPLDIAVLSNAIQRGILAAPFALPYDPNPPEGNIRAFPTSDLDPVAEAAAAGYTEERLFVETALAGNPPGPEALLRGFFRGALTWNDVLRGLNEGRARAEWAPGYLADARAIPSPGNFVEGRVRNWIDDAGMLAGTARHGMTPEDTNLLFLIHGRPLSWHQVFIGLRRGGTYNGPTDDIDPAFLKALQESDIRPEWYNLAWAQRYSYPSAFVLRALATSGELDHDTTLQVLMFEGWEPTLAEKVASTWTGGGAGGTGTTTPKPKTFTYSQIHAAWRNGVFDDATALTELEGIGYSAAKAQTLLNTWKATPASGQ